MDNRTVEERFWARVDTASDVTACWPWTAGLSWDGYGKFGAEGKTWRAHIYAWERKRGPVPEGLCVCHTCDNTRCCNDAHLFVGTKQQNNADRHAKGHSRGGPRRAASGEGHGHAKLTWGQVREIRRRVGTASYKQLGHEFGVSSSSIFQVISGTIWRETAQCT